jgi:hypothetical protein
VALYFDLGVALADLQTGALTRRQWMTWVEWTRVDEQENARAVECPRARCGCRLSRVGDRTTDAESAHTHSVPSLSVPSLSVPALAVGSIDMPNLGTLPYVRR